MPQKKITKLKQSDMYDRYKYKGYGGDEIGRLKSYNNDTKTAFIVFNCNNDRDNRLDYTAQGCKYEDIENSDSVDKMIAEKIVENNIY